jgi:hypothetical protein
MASAGLLAGSAASGLEKMPTFSRRATETNGPGGQRRGNGSARVKRAALKRRNVLRNRRAHRG